MAPQSTQQQTEATLDQLRVQAPALLTTHGLSRFFEGVAALSGMTMEVRRGEIVGLVGENGAGKSTLLNLLSGSLRPDEGRIEVRGRATELADYRQATEQGIFRVFQELALLPNVPVYENMFLAHEGRFQTAGFLNRGRMRQAAGRVLEEFGHGWIDPTASTGALDFPSRQALDIIRAFALAELLEIETPILLLDEPTSALTRQDVGFVMDLLRDVRPRAGVVFVSHRLTEVLELSDRIYVLKDGQQVAETTPGDTTEAQLHELMVGRLRDVHFYKESRQRRPELAPVLEVHGLTRAPEFADVSLSVHRGEILGVGGVLGSGKSSMARALLGALPNTTGAVEVEGRGLPRRWSVRDMVHAGVGYLPPDRNTDGLIVDFPVAWNISLARVAMATDGHLTVHKGRERSKARDLVERLAIKTRSVSVPAKQLSGGNQQKVALARWLALGVKLLVVDNPTRGVDAGAKEQIYELMRSLADAGVAFLVVSDDLLELIGLSNRILVMKDGRIAGQIDTPPEDKPTESQLVAQMV